MINCEVPLIWTWSENCALTRKVARGADANADPTVDEISIPTNATSKITVIKLYIPVATLSAQDDNELIRTIKKRIWKNCKME